MKLFFPKREKKEFFLALDIGTAAVKALIFKTENEKIIILGTSLRYLDRFGVFDSRAFEIDIIKKAILKAIEEAQKQANIIPEYTFLGLPANILKGRIIFQSFRRGSPKEIIDQKEEKEIYRQVLKEAQKKISQISTQETGILPTDLQFIDSKILEIKIEGYEVPQLQGFDGKNLDFRILIIFLPKYYLENFQKIFKDYNPPAALQPNPTHPKKETPPTRTPPPNTLNLKVLSITHEAQNLIKAFKEPNAISLDVGGEVSRIFLVNRGKLEKIDEMEIGGKVFTESLSQNLGLNIERARILKERYSKGELSEKTRKRIKEIFSPPLQTWFRNLKLKLQNFKKIPLPSTIFLFGGGSLLPEIQEILEEGLQPTHPPPAEGGPLWEASLSIAKPQVKFLYPRDLKKIEDKTKSLNSPKDISPILLCYEAI